MIRFGTCSWKYDAWRGIIYSGKKNINYLKEYSNHYSTVEIDQWFWSLFPPSKVLLPDERVVNEYKSSVPKDFIFTIKIPNSITLTHFYNRDKKGPLTINPYFLSVDLFKEFLSTLKPLEANIGCLIFQFEYLNKQKMKSLSEFQDKFIEFHSKMSSLKIPLGIEIRNPNYLNESYFNFLKVLKIAHVFLEGYYMPPIVDVYERHKDFFSSFSVIRLHGPDRKGIEKLANDNWNKIYVDREKEIKPIVEMIKELNKNKVDLFINVNNHFEGSAPLTVNRIKNYLEPESQN